MACNECTSLESIPECSESIAIGKVTVLTEVYIYVKNIFTDYVHREEVTSDADGDIILDLAFPDPSFYNSDSQYEVWATLRTDSDRLDITYAYGLTDTCLNISFFRVNDTTEEA